MDNVGPAFTLYLNDLLCGLLQDCALELVFQLFLRFLKRLILLHPVLNLKSVLLQPFFVCEFLKLLFIIILNEESKALWIGWVKSFNMHGPLFCAIALSFTGELVNFFRIVLSSELE